MQMVIIMTQEGNWSMDLVRITILFLSVVWLTSCESREKPCNCSLPPDLETIGLTPQIYEFNGSEGGEIQIQTETPSYFSSSSSDIYDWKTKIYNERRDYNNVLKIIKSKYYTLEQIDSTNYSLILNPCEKNYLLMLEFRTLEGYTNSGNYIEITCHMESDSEDL